MEGNEILGRLYEMVKWDYEKGGEPKRGNMNMSEYVETLIDEAEEYLGNTKVVYFCMNCRSQLIDGYCPECDMREPR